MPDNDDKMILDRVSFIADAARYAPAVAGAMLSALDAGEKAALLGLLEKTAGGAGDAFGAKDADGQGKAPELAPGEGDDLAENEILCLCCDMRCRVSWAEDGSVSGAKCQCGMQMAREAIKNRADRADG